MFITKNARECEEKILQTLADYELNQAEGTYILHDILDKLGQYSHIKYESVKKSNDDQQNIH